MQQACLAVLGPHHMLHLPTCSRWPTHTTPSVEAKVVLCWGNPSIKTSRHTTRWMPRWGGGAGCTLLCQSWALLTPSSWTLSHGSHQPYIHRGACWLGCCQQLPAMQHGRHGLHTSYMGLCIHACMQACCCATAPAVHRSPQHAPPAQEQSLLWSASVRRYI